MSSTDFSEEEGRVPLPMSIDAAESQHTVGIGRHIVNWRRWVKAANSVGIFLVLVALVVAFSVAAPDAFPTTFNAQSISSDAASLLVLAVGLTFVVIAAGIDLSIGSVLVFSSVIAAKAMIWVGGTDSGWGGILFGLVAGIAAGLGWGIVNGFLVAKARIPALIVTLGTLGAALGLAEVLTSGLDVRDVPERLTNTVGVGKAFAGIPWLVLIAAVVTIVGALVLAYTRFGRHTYAVGSSVEAARRAGINVNRHLLKVYALQGGLAGLAGWLSIARYSTTTISGHSTDNLSAIAAVVLGGTSLFGGIGTIFGTVIGVFIPVVLQNGFVIVGFQPFWQEVAVGAVLIAAVFIDQLRRRARE